MCQSRFVMFCLDKTYNAQQDASYFFFENIITGTVALMLLFACASRHCCGCRHVSVCGLLYLVDKSKLEEKDDDDEDDDDGEDDGDDGDDGYWQ